MALRVCTGFEFGTTAGWTTGNAGNKIADAVGAGTAPTVITTVPRTGTYCMQLSGTSSDVRLAWDTNTLAASQNRGVAAFGVYLPSSLPAGDVRLAQFTSPTSQNGEFWYHQSTGKLAGKIESGSFVDGPTANADTWYYVELYYNNSADPQTLDWAVDATSQTQATGAGTASTIGGFNLGGRSDTPQTFTARYDDLAIWTDTAAITFPVGKHTVRLLSVDPAGTVTLSGTAANFNTFTANGTLAAWNATTARDNTDEIPPTIGGSADGWVQITLQTTEYVESPLTTYTLAAGETVAGARMLVPGWAASTTAATVGFRSWNGTTETTLFAAADPNFDNSTTAPAWVCKMLTLADIDTQSELDALAIRAGFSGDATPDIGIHAIYVELAIKESTGAVVLPTLVMAPKLPT